MWPGNSWRIDEPQYSLLLDLRMFPLGCAFRFELLLPGFLPRQSLLLSLRFGSAFPFGSLSSFPPLPFLFGLLLRRAFRFGSQPLLLGCFARQRFGLASRAKWSLGGLARVVAGCPPAAELDVLRLDCFTLAYRRRDLEKALDVDVV